MYITSFLMSKYR